MVGKKNIGNDKEELNEIPCKCFMQENQGECNETTKIGREGGYEGDKMGPSPSNIYVSIHTLLRMN